MNRRMFSLCLNEADINSQNGVHRKLWITATGRTSLIILLAARLPVRLVHLIAVLYVIQFAPLLVRRPVHLPANHSVPHPAVPACPVSRPAVPTAIPPANRGPNASRTARQAADRLSFKNETVPFFQKRGLSHFPHNSTLRLPADNYSLTESV